MPPILVQVGDVEVLLDDAKNLVGRAKSAGVDARLSIYPEMPHVWQLSYPAFPEAVTAVREIADFVDEITRS
jgi:acetyl esterase/lipase